MERIPYRKYDARVKDQSTTPVDISVRELTSARAQHHAQVILPLRSLYMKPHFHTSKTLLQMPVAMDHLVTVVVGYTAFCVLFLAVFVSHSRGSTFSRRRTELNA